MFSFISIILFYLQNNLQFLITVLRKSKMNKQTKI